MVGDQNQPLRIGGQALKMGRLKIQRESSLGVGWGCYRALSIDPPGHEFERFPSVEELVLFYIPKHTMFQRGRVVIGELVQEHATLVLRDAPQAESIRIWAFTDHPSARHRDPQQQADPVRLRRFPE